MEAKPAREAVVEAAALEGAIGVGEQEKELAEVRGQMGKFPIEVAV